MATMTDAEVREALGISKGAVARWAGVTDGAVGRHEAGEKPVDPSAADQRLGRVYGALRALCAARWPLGDGGQT